MCTFASPSETRGFENESSLIMAPAAILKKVSILSCSTLEERTKFIDNIERDNEVKRDYSLIRIEVFSSCKGCNFIGKTSKTRDVE